MKKHLLALGLSLFAFQSIAATAPTAPTLEASAYMFYDVQSGQILTSKNPDARIEPASLTKLMTAYLTFAALKEERLTLEQKLTVSDKAWKSEGSRMFLDPKVPVSVEDLIKGMIVQSGNDACVTLAEAIAGSEEGFAQMMNAQAKKLGMLNSNFTNSTGLPDENLYTTVHDLAILSKALINDFPEFYPTYALKSFTYNNITQPNRNLLLYRDSSVDGLKTGHTESAGYNLIASSKRDGRRVISVVVGTKSMEARATESSKLLNWGLSHYQTPKLYDANQALSKVEVFKGSENQLDVGFLEPVYITLPRGSEDVTPVLETNQPVVAPIAKGTQMGTLKLMSGNTLLAERPVVALQNIEEAGFFGRMWDSIVLWFKRTF
ncbi:D-alanyl-D-alanine carboxypeptidase family protein [Vitreoscilla stercoraria]|uniref:serine-type D-Ala-D-Ala carboxypeptidase n=1 Tax=Vitreoscilla stercoraria TaxID=61 RepID=A0ABY4EEZ7_VITST|nr:D-alanyl-D-alanine carboxypeptidase family protein [Vitreoscilla stercoraria]UOO93510.1 D-alanyl-D-alanine carboxypeptidase [Vitreoscilla stercoraria]